MHVFSTCDAAPAGSCDSTSKGPRFKPVWLDKREQTATTSESVRSLFRLGIVQPGRRQRVIEVSVRAHFLSPPVGGDGGEILPHFPSISPPSKPDSPKLAGRLKKQNPDDTLCTSGFAGFLRNTLDLLTYSRSSPDRSPSRKPASRLPSNARSRMSRASAGSTFPST